MASRESLLLLVTPLVLGGCVRWGIPDDDYGYDDYGYDSTTYDYYDDSTTYDPDGTSSDDGTTTASEPDVHRRPTRAWPEQRPLSPESRLSAWGKSGIPTVNLELMANVFHDLAGVAPGEGPLTILWIADCDPRIDAEGCGVGDVQPFFDLVDSLGTIDFMPPEATDPFAYDVVVADFCEPIDGEVVTVLLEVGMGVLALGDRSCSTPTGTSAKLANDVIAHFGLRFGSQTLDDPRFLVPPEAQSDLLEGIVSIVASHVSLQETLDPAFVVVEAADGVLLSRRAGS
ncbi:hypothetical protein [Paraliomyxa miuraensis]|uniref:hypothetical protein n=1 Tax=Paraliomyxa miuraensis TaxID=376150 RepID=UPI00224DFBE7|nr:hypothetical protein [Paraliomyxa miuraensis]MCX4247959.1 hypothetical protein [Paraliomyxa miuraensis]